MGMIKPTTFIHTYIHRYLQNTLEPDFSVQAHVHTLDKTFIDVLELSVSSCMTLVAD